VVWMLGAAIALQLATAQCLLRPGSARPRSIPVRRDFDQGSLDPKLRRLQHPLQRRCSNLAESPYQHIEVICGSIWLTEYAELGLALAIISGAMSSRTGCRAALEYATSRHVRRCAKARLVLLSFHIGVNSARKVFALSIGFGSQVPSAVTQHLTCRRSTNATTSELRRPAIGTAAH
jgi:hypothetical protein